MLTFAWLGVSVPMPVSFSRLSRVFGAMQGLDWDVGAIGNAAWTGVRLSDVLKVVLSSNDDSLAYGVCQTCCKGAPGMSLLCDAGADQSEHANTRGLVH